MKAKIITIGDEILLKNTIEIIFNLTKLFNYDHLILDVLNISKINIIKSYIILETLRYKSVKAIM